jgi:hypothetical protein
VKAVEEAVEYVDECGCADERTATTLHRQAALLSLTADEMRWAVKDARATDPDNPCAFLVWLFGEVAAGYCGPNADARRASASA